MSELYKESNTPNNVFYELTSKINFLERRIHVLGIELSELKDDFEDANKDADRLCKYIEHHRNYDDKYQTHIIILHDDRIEELEKRDSEE